MIDKILGEMVSEIYVMADPGNAAILFGSLGAMWMIFTMVYHLAGQEWMKPDFKISAFESEFWKKFAFYLGWAFIQQSIVIAFSSFFKTPFTSYIVSVCLFTVGYHMLNWRLMGFTFCFSAVFYALWFFAGFQSFIYLSILHAFGGTAYYKLGWEMRVWRTK